MNVAVLIPYAPADEWREAARLRTLEHLCSVSWPIVLGVGQATAWNKGRALAHATEETPDADVYVLHDADCIVPIPALIASVGAVLEGEPWGVPHRWVHRLNRQATVDVLDGSVMPWDVPHAERERLPYRGVPGGGVLVVRGDVWRKYPLDPRFVGWGGEDEAYGWALTTLYGGPWRPPTGDDRLWHLWHPHAAPQQRLPGRAESRALLQAYRNARGIPRIMRAVIADHVPEPPIRLDPPIRYRAAPGARTMRSLRVGGQVVRFHGGLAEVTHGDAAEVLDRMAGVQRV